MVCLTMYAFLSISFLPVLIVVDQSILYAGRLSRRPLDITVFCCRSDSASELRR